VRLGCDQDNSPALPVESGSFPRLFGTKNTHLNFIVFLTLHPIEVPNAGIGGNAPIFICSESASMTALIGSWPG
jgi:hypothetical protein